MAKAGRPTAYDPKFAAQALKLCLLGATEQELATFFEVSRTTIKAWKKNNADFAEALIEGKDSADSNVAKRLYQRALGFSHKSEKIFADPKTGKILKVRYTEKFAPDVVACIFWLKNRQPHLWRDKHDISTDLGDAVFTLAFPKPGSQSSGGTGGSDSRSE